MLTLSRRLRARVCLLTLLGFGIHFAPSPSSLAASALPLVKQKYAADCGRAVLASLVAIMRGQDPKAVYRSVADAADRVNGYSLRELQQRIAALPFSIELAVTAPTSPAGFILMQDCTDAPHIVAFFGHLGDAINSGAPAIMPTKVSGMPAHYLLLVERRGEQFVAIDPARSVPQIIARKQLQEITCHFGHVALLPVSND